VSESIPYTRAVPFSRPAGRRRIEVFSPKIGRHLSLGGYDAYRTWLVIEANPHIVTFCERPTYVDGPRGPVIDFWVQLRGAPSGEFWMEERLPRPSSKTNNAPPERHSHVHDLAMQYTRRADLFGWAIPISNWARITPYLVSHRRYRDALLEQQKCGLPEPGRVGPAKDPGVRYSTSVCSLFGCGQRSLRCAGSGSDKANCQRGAAVGEYVARR